MAHLVFSLAGEGRGHAVRARTLLERLKAEHRLTVFAPDQAYEFLAPLYAHTRDLVQIERIPGLRFHYTNSRMDVSRSIWEGCKYAAFTLPSVVRKLRKFIDREQPDLAIIDFEPALSRAAYQSGLPTMILDHQHVLRACDFSMLPRELARHAASMSWAIWAFYAPAERTLASSFYTPPLKPEFQYVKQVGPLLRDEVTRRRTTSGEHVLSYLRPQTAEGTLEILSHLPCPVKVYGLGERPRRGNLTFLPIHESTFLDDLASCRAVISAAGNQLCGEAVYLGKPMLTLPENQHFEQRINAWFLREMGAGDVCELEEFSTSRLLAFWDELPRFEAAAAMYRGQNDGTPVVLAEIDDMLRRHAPTIRSTELSPTRGTLAAARVPAKPQLST
jgi:uncharacterized protein (TIGR00661 family)